MARPVSIIGKVVEVVTDRNQFKPYSPRVVFDDLFVEFEIPAEHAVEHEGGYIVTHEGFARYILDPFCKEIEVMHRAWEQAEAKRLEAEEDKRMRRGAK